jgi:radical SAM protein with 4Fe4S-binding SPASM domain
MGWPMKNLLGARSYPSWIVLQLVERCNLRCNMCYEWGESGAYHAVDKLAELDPEVLNRAIKDCLAERPFVEFFGGEPLLYAGIWDLIKQIRQADCSLAFPTNGTLIAEYADRLVETQPNLIWVSVDGPQEINDRQRGRGVFKRAMRGLEGLSRIKRAKGSRFPEIGIAYVVTPLSFRYIEEFFLKELDLAQVSHISIELQSYATKTEYGEYSAILRERFGVQSTPCAKAYVRDPAIFAGMDSELITKQLVNVRRVCVELGISFFSQPRTLQSDNIASYLSADWSGMIDKRNHCGVPWAYAEISARGEVTTCHTFYDLSVGNIHEASLLEIWNGKRLSKVREFLEERLFPICTACCRYHAGAVPIAASVA